MDDKIINKQISFDEFMNVISIYYMIKMRIDVKFESELLVKYNLEQVYPELNIYYVSYIGGEKIKCLLRYEDIFEPLRVYVNNLGYELINFKYDGGIKRTGYYVDNDTPFINGVLLNMKKKKHVKKLYRK